MTTQVVNRNGQGIADSALQDLKAALRGDAVGPEDPAYEAARGVWNGNIDRHPGLIVHCTGVADVMTAVNFARENDVLVAVRGGAHNAAGHGTCDGGIVINLTPMKDIRVDPELKVAHVQPGESRRHDSSAPRNLHCGWLVASG